MFVILMISTRWLLTAAFKMAFVKFLSQNERNCEDCSTRLDLEKFCKLQIIKPRGRRLAKSVSRLIVSSRNAVGCGFNQYISQLRVNFRSKWRDNYFFPFKKTVRIFNLQKKSNCFFLYSIQERFIGKLNLFKQFNRYGFSVKANLEISCQAIHFPTHK